MNRYEDVVEECRLVQDALGWIRCEAKKMINGGCEIILQDAPDRFATSIFASSPVWKALVQAIREAKRPEEPPDVVDASPRDLQTLR